jgi:hypothetical protein
MELDDLPLISVGMPHPENVQGIARDYKGGKQPEDEKQKEKKPPSCLALIILIFLIVLMISLFLISK